MKKRHLHNIVLESNRMIEANKDSVAAALALLNAGTDHLPITEVPSVSDRVGRGLCSIGSEQSTLSGNKSGRTSSTMI